MTAEVAIANASAIALATDSAVTIGKDKIYNSALKLFSLSKLAPVGIMVYGNASILDVPWEIIIKKYREELADRRFDTLSEYSDDFISFIGECKEAFPEERQKDWLKHSTNAVFSMIKDAFLERVEEEFVEASSVASEKASELFSNIVDEHYTLLDEKKFSEGYKKEDLATIKRKYKAVINNEMEYVFEKLSFTAATKKKLLNIGVLVPAKAVYFDNNTGVVFAGYGESEIYPKLETYEIDGILLNRPVYEKIKSKCYSIDSGNEGLVVPFAQENVIASFMNGIDPDTKALVESYLSESIDHIPELLDKNLSEHKKKKYLSKLTLLKEKFLKDFDNYTFDEHTRRKLHMVTVLPKDELAEMAEMLVSLTAFKHRVTQSIETVGGPIDVAVISKGDGMVWVKRKHYFPAELNQQFFNNYFTSISS